MPKIQKKFPYITMVVWLHLWTFTTVVVRGVTINWLNEVVVAAVGFCLSWWWCWRIFLCAGCTGWRRWSVAVMEWIGVNLWTPTVTIGLCLLIWHCWRICWCGWFSLLCWPNLYGLGSGLGSVRWEEGEH